MQDKPAEFMSYVEAAAVAGPDQWPSIIRSEYIKDKHGQTTRVQDFWALFEKPCFLKPRDVETSGPYRGSYSDEVVGF